MEHGAGWSPMACTIGGSKWLTSHCLIFQHDEMEVNRILYLCTCLSFTLHGSVCFVETKLLISCKTECAVTPLSVHVERLLSPSFCSTEAQLLVGCGLTLGQKALAAVGGKSQSGFGKLR